MSPVAYTCSTLPCASNDVVAAAALPANTSPTIAAASQLPIHIFRYMARSLNHNASTQVAVPS